MPARHGLSTMVLRIKNALRPVTSPALCVCFASPLTVTTEVHSKSHRAIGNLPGIRQIKIPLWYPGGHSVSTQALPLGLFRSCVISSKERENLAKMFLSKRAMLARVRNAAVLVVSAGGVLGAAPSPLYVRGYTVIPEPQKVKLKGAARAKELGSPSKLWVEYTQKTAAYLRDRGRKVIFWGEEPRQAEEVPSLPSGLINGEVYNKAFRARGIPEIIYTNSLPDDPLFPFYSRVMNLEVRSEMLEACHERK
jgi:hypothetical protein